MGGRNLARGYQIKPTKQCKKYIQSFAGFLQHPLSKQKMQVEKQEYKQVYSRDSHTCEDLLVIYTCSTIVANCPRISGTVPDFLPLSRMGPGRLFYP